MISFPPKAIAPIPAIVWAPIATDWSPIARALRPNAVASLISTFVYPFVPPAILWKSVLTSLTPNAFFSTSSLVSTSVAFPAGILLGSKLLNPAPAPAPTATEELIEIALSLLTPVKAPVPIATPPASSPLRFKTPLLLPETAPAPIATL